MAIATTDEDIQDEVRYFDTLYDFVNVISRLNDKAFDGVAKNAIEKNFCKLIPAFTLLCGVNTDDNIDISEVGNRKKPVADLRRKHKNKNHHKNQSRKNRNRYHIIS